MSIKKCVKVDILLNTFAYSGSITGAGDPLKYVVGNGSSAHVNPYDRNNKKMFGLHNVEVNSLLEKIALSNLMSEKIEKSGKLYPSSAKALFCIIAVTGLFTVIEEIVIELRFIVISLASLKLIVLFVTLLSLK